MTGEARSDAAAEVRDAPPATAFDGAEAHGSVILHPCDPAPIARARDDGDAPLSLRDAVLYAGRFDAAPLRDADLRQADLRTAVLEGADLRGARLCAADLTHADLRGADLRGADLSGADLSGADLREADLRGADLADAALDWARLAGARGVPDRWNQRPRVAGRVLGERTATGEPAAGVRAWRRGQQAHQSGRLGQAEAHFRMALRWVPESDAARYGLGCVALERGDTSAARRWWADAVATEPEADRARLELALLSPSADEVAALLAPLHGRGGRVEACAQAMVAAAQADDWTGAADAAGALLGDAPAVRWVHNGGRAPAPVREAPRPDDTIARLGDEAWVAAEREDLERTLADWQASAPADQLPWRLHSVIARAVTVGALDLATLAEQRLARVAPEQRLWGMELQNLDLTAQAVAALVRTRRQRLGAVQSVRWVALGAHGPTARVQCEGGLVYAKRWQGAVRPPPSVAFTHRVCRGLAEGGLRVPLPLADAVGDDVMVFAGDLLALYPALPGRSIREERIDVDEAARVGATLARVHALGEAASSGRPAGGLRNGTRILRHRSPGAAWELAVARDTQAARWLEQHPARRQIEGLLDVVAQRLRSVSGRCRVGLCHGDFGAGNVLFDAAGEPAVLDWDLAEVDLTVWDLARTIDRLGVHWSGVRGRPVEVRAPVIQAIRAGYERVRPLNDAELRALPVLVAASRVDLDASVVPLCAPLEPESAEPIMRRMVQRLSHAAAGSPTVAAALSPG